MTQTLICCDRQTKKYAVAFGASYPLLKEVVGRMAESCLGCGCFMGCCFSADAYGAHDLGYGL